jgi:hypothetical protein
MERWIDDKFGRFFWEWGAEVLGAGGRGREGREKAGCRQKSLYT